MIMEFVLILVVPHRLKDCLNEFVLSVCTFFYLCSMFKEGERVNLNEDSQLGARDCA